MPQAIRERVKDWPPERRARLETGMEEALADLGGDGPAPATLLRAFDEALAENGRLARVVRSLLEMQTGERIPDGIVADYLERLGRGNADRERMEEMVMVMWTLVGGREGRQPTAGTGMSDHHDAA
jgi:hypothetical protein